MRACRRLVLLGVVSLALLSSAAAQADIGPIAKPPGGPVAPLERPHVNATVRVAPARAATPRASTRSTSTRSTRTTTVTVSSSSGGRSAELQPLFSAGGRDAAQAPSAIARPLPTPLALVGIHEALPSHEAWPAWLLGAIALLASAEAFVLTRLVRASQLVEPTEP